MKDRIIDRIRKRDRLGPRYRPENGIDESGDRSLAKRLGQSDRFIDGGRGRDPVQKENLVRPQP
jgi:hypothetical protein